MSRLKLHSTKDFRHQAALAGRSTIDRGDVAILQPHATLFRALHALTAQADPREVEAQGDNISTAAANSGAALGDGSMRRLGEQEIRRSKSSGETVSQDFRAK